jgi:hypothetical protein
MDWLIGASSSFEVTTEGAVDGAMAGTATFRADEEGHLVGIELVHIDDSTRGLSIELEPRPIEKRTYEAVAPRLLGIERRDAAAGFTAYFESSEHSFQSSRGTLQLTHADASHVRGTFEIEMDGRSSGNGGIAEGDVTVQGTFEATRRDE